MDIDKSVVMARGKVGAGGWWVGGGGQRGRNGDICNSVNNKNKRTKNTINLHIHFFAIDSNKIS